MNKSPHQVVFLDVDNTLIRGYSGFYTTLALIRKGIIRKRKILAAFFYKLASPVYKGNLARMYRLVIEEMAGLRLEEVLKVGQECFERDILPRFYAEALELVRRLKGEGRPVYLITSGPGMTIEAVARFLGVDGQTSCGPVIRDGILLNELKEPLCYREGKVAAAEAVLRSLRSDFSSASYYADNIDDLPLLERVGHPVLVNPDRRLRKIGESRRWPILHWR